MAGWRFLHKRWSALWLQTGRPHSFLGWTASVLKDCLATGPGSAILGNLLFFCALLVPDVCENFCSALRHPAAGLGRCGCLCGAAPTALDAGPLVCHVRAVHGRCAHRSWPAQWRAVGDWRTLGFTFVGARGQPVVGHRAGHWWALLLGWGFGAWLYRLHAAMHRVPASMLRSTSYFAGRLGPRLDDPAIRAENARTDLVAASHSLRLLIVTITIPFACGGRPAGGWTFDPPPCAG